MLLFCTGCTLIVGDPDPRDQVPNQSLDLASSGCADVQTDPRNCGSCGHDCTRLPGVDPTLVGCTIGVCNLRNACLSGRADCSGGYLDGCETDLTNANSCGGCTVQCGGTEALCAGDAFGHFTCTGTCPSTQPTQCGSSCVDLFNDPQHCGSCTNACAAPNNSAAVCQNGVCGSACNPGFHTCNGFCLDNTSLQSCGTACTPCPAPPAHGTEVCDNFAGCSFQCNSGFVNQLGACVPGMSSLDMATGGNQPCDCTSSGLVACLDGCVGKDCCGECLSSSPLFAFCTTGVACTADPSCNPS